MGHKELDTAEQQCYMEKQKDMCSALVDKQGRFKRTEISAGLLTCDSQSTLEEKQNINKGITSTYYLPLHFRISGISCLRSAKSKVLQLKITKTLPLF